MSTKTEAFKNALFAYELGLITREELNKRIYTLNNTPSKPAKEEKVK